jgi:hypothetical protein
MKLICRSLGAVLCTALLLTSASNASASTILINPGALGAINGQLNLNVLPQILGALGPMIGSGGAFEFDFVFDGKAIEISPVYGPEMFAQLELSISPENPVVDTFAQVSSMFLLNATLTGPVGTTTDTYSSPQGNSVNWTNTTAITGLTFYGIHIAGTLPTYLDGDRTIMNAFLKMGPFMNNGDPEMYGEIIALEEMAPVPEPGTFALLGLGALGLVGARLRARSKKS